MVCWATGEASVDEEPKRAAKDNPWCRLAMLNRENLRRDRLLLAFGERCEFRVRPTLLAQGGLELIR
jgi:hypothetical protein